jgi:transposase InsO family protein
VSTITSKTTQNIF